MSRNKKKTHCPRGHEYAGSNLGLRFSQNGNAIKYCIACVYIDRAALTHCPQGHAYTDENTGYYKRGNRTGRCRYCKQCKSTGHKTWRMQDGVLVSRSQNWLLWKYGISAETFESMKVAQNDCCAICKKPFAKEKGMEPVVDHNHQTNKNRGLLHRKCNLALGVFQDDPAICVLAAEYLQKWTERTQGESED